MMIPYENKSGKSDVTGYDIQQDCILVEFNNEVVYTYTVDSAGPAVIQTMKSLALASEGLGRYISQYKPPHTGTKIPVAAGQKAFSDKEKLNNLMERVSRLEKTLRYIIENPNKLDTISSWLDAEDKNGKSPEANPIS